MVLLTVQYSLPGKRQHGKCIRYLNIMKMGRLKQPFCLVKMYKHVGQLSLATALIYLYETYPAAVFKLQDESIS